MARILVVDDEPKIRRQITVLMGEAGHRVDQAGEVGQALELINGSVYDLLITDVRLPDGSGIKLLEEAREIQPAIAVVVITAYGSVKDAVKAMRRGALDYIQKPFMLEGLKLVCERAFHAATLRAEHQYMLEEFQTSRGGVRLVGSSPAMARIRELITVVAAQPSTVLVTGESGTGKELVAEAIHLQSGGQRRPLVRVNCPAIPKDLFESELFGHLKGAFTGAVESRKGKFELADGGTLFLDEISEIPLDLQSKLLRVLEERRFTRVGGTQEIEVSLRIIGATNRDIKQAAREGRFRQDLYYRLNVFPLHIGPLRQRLEDIPQLAAHLLQTIATQYHVPHRGISEGALQRLQLYRWPGNVRELRNVLERGLLLSQSEEVDVAHLPQELVEVPDADEARAATASGLNRQVEDFRRQVLWDALEQHQWRKKEAAAALGLSPRALSHYISKYDLDRKR